MNDDIREVHLNRRAEEANAIRQMCQTPGFKILQEKFEEKIKKATTLLIDLNTPDEKVKEIRQKIHVWTEITNMLKSLIITGDHASKLLREEDLV